jgi:LmbE family N-acetylglucosaminyl deacetylase
MNLLQYTQAFERLLEQGRAIPHAVPIAARPAPAPGAPLALLLSPHPDDEALTGGLPLRLLQEAGWRVLNLPVTLGSALAQRARRWAELQASCDCLGFELLPAVHQTEGRLDPQLQTRAPRHWASCVQTVTEALLQLQPKALFFPHAGDVQPTHVGTHALALAALRAAGSRVQTATVHTEFWGTLAQPNLMLELDAPQLAQLAEATACHAGEVARNPYHLNLPAQCIDAVRRGAELVGGLGQAAPAMAFAMLYRVQRWNGAEEVTLLEGGRSLPLGASVSGIL